MLYFDFLNKIESKIENDMWYLNWDYESSDDVYNYDFDKIFGM